MIQKRKERKNGRKWVSRVLFFMLFVVAVVICYFVYEVYFKEKDSGITDDSGVIQTTEEFNDSGDSVGSEDDNVEVPEKDKVIQYEGEDPNLSEELSGSVTYAGVLNNRITIRVNIDQYLSEGSCALSLLSNDTVIYSESANIINSASTATCEGFDIPVSNVRAGDYEIIIIISSYGKSGVIKGRVEV